MLSTTQFAIFSFCLAVSHWRFKGLSSHLVLTALLVIGYWLLVIGSLFLVIGSLFLVFQQ
jgi:hypothetical protein